MVNQRPPDPNSGDDRHDQSDATDATRPERATGQGAVPRDAQPTMPIQTPPPATPSASTPAQNPVSDGERLTMLQRLSATELAVLRLRCSGATTLQISHQLGLTHADAMAHTGNILDKLGVTYGREGTSLSRMAAFCPLTSQLGASAGSAGIPVVPPAGLPSQRAEELTYADDEALLMQQGGPPPGPPPPAASDGRQRWIVGGILALVLVAALVALLFLLGGDDDDDEDTLAEATSEAATQTAAAAVEPTEPGEEPTPTAEPEPTEPEEEPTATEEPEATEVPPTETAEPEPTATEAEPTETPEPTVTPTPTKTATATATATEEPEPEPTATKAPTPTNPSQGTLAYESDWSGNEDGWELTDGWTIDGGELVADGASAGPLLGPFQPQGANYAVEVEMNVTGINNCNKLVGAFARVSEETTGSGEVLTGYAGNVCATEWRLDAVETNDRDTLESGQRNFATGWHVYRLEVSGERLRLFIDNAFVGEANDDRFTETGGVGIYLEGDADITVRAFKVYTID